MFSFVAGRKSGVHLHPVTDWEGYFVKSTLFLSSMETVSNKVFAVRQFHFSVGQARSAPLMLPHARKRLTISRWRRAFG